MPPFRAVNKVGKITGADPDMPIIADVTTTGRALA